MTVVNNYTALLSGSYWSGIEVTGKPVIVTYSFPTSAPGYDISIQGFTSATIASFQAFSAAEQAQAQAALGEWAAASGIVFLQVAPGLGDINFGVVDLTTQSMGDYSNVGGIGFFPFGEWNSLTYPGYSGDLDSSGDIFMNSIFENPDDTVAYGTLLHEIGHALGFKHPTETFINYAAQPTPVVHDQVLASDDANVTIMASVYTPGAGEYLKQIDKDAAAFAYGAAGTGGVYTSSASGSNSVVSAWSYDSVAGTVTQTGYATDDSIRGTSINDTIHGLDGADHLYGLAGDDVLDGGDGNDWLYGGLGVNQMIGGTGDDTYMVENSADTITEDAAAGNDKVYAFVSYTLSANLEYLQVFGAGLTATGNDQANTLFGDGDQATTLNGMGGADYIGGGAGDDLIDGGAGNDTIYAGGGADTVNGGADNDNLIGGGGDDILNGDGGTDYFGYVADGGGVNPEDSGFDAIDGGAGYDYVVAYVNNAIFGFNSIVNVEAITSNGHSGVSIRGSSASNSFDFSGVTLTGVTLIDMGAGNDTLTGSSIADTIRGNSGNDTLNGGGGGDIFQYSGTGEGYDAVDGGSGSDTILALSDNTKIGLISIAGIETISGGERANVTISTDGGGRTLDFSGTYITGIVDIYGGVGNDTITGSAVRDSIKGLGGNDTLNGGGALDIINGGAGDDTISGDSGYDLLFGDDGNDSFLVSNTVGDGYDTVDGGAGTDTILAMVDNAYIGLSSVTGVELISGGGHTNVTIHADNGARTLDFTGATLSGIVAIYGGSSGDTITGTAGGDVIKGLNGDDVLKGAGGLDIINGGNGNDTITGGAGYDILYGDDGLDVFEFSGLADGYDSISGGNGSDTIRAMSDGTQIALMSLDTVETITANGHADVTIVTDNGGRTLNFTGVTLTGIAEIDGGSKADTLTGGSGADVIDGRGGKDVLAGGLGADRFVFANLAHSAVGAADLITDFSQAQGDVIDLHLLDADLGLANDQAFNFLGAVAFGHQAGELIYAQSGGQTHIFGDVNGDAIADFQIDLAGNITLNAADFVA